jgi:plastocyanin
MFRGIASLLIALVVGLGLAPGLPTAAPALADGMGGWGMMGPMGGMMAGAGITGGGLRPGCGRGEQSVPAGAIAGLPSVTISIVDGAFVPDQVTVPAGTRVVWVNNGTQPHTSTAWDRWDSGVLRPGQGCEAWFVTPGSYDYLSIVAADGGTMRGTITVQGSLPSGPTTAGMMPGGPTMPGMPPMGGPGY